MELKYNITIDNNVIQQRLKNLINQIYKLLPIRQEGSDWQKPLQTIIEEMAGMQRLMNCNFSEIFFPLLNKLEGLYSLTQNDDFYCYRRTIFECLSLMNNLQRAVLCLRIIK